MLDGSLVDVDLSVIAVVSVGFVVSVFVVVELWRTVLEVDESSFAGVTIVVIALFGSGVIVVAEDSALVVMVPDVGGTDGVALTATFFSAAFSV